MTTIRIRKTIDSETLRLPELRPFIGQTVDIVIGESAPAGTGITPGQGDWDTVLAASRQLVDYDYQAQIDQDACDLRDMEEMRERMK
ncbi:MAG: hypothetical protein J2P46_08630 [Zavarzinella sp.]|nr:hypothetical protein [Zavarzinella sp.]